MRLLLVFLNEPIAGQVKPELAAALGDEEAARYYQALVEVLLKQLQGLQQTRIRFCYTPDDAGDAVKFWLLPIINAKAGNEPSTFHAPDSPADQDFRQEIDFHPQGEGDLSQRINRAFAHGFADGYTAIAAINSDSPDCGARWINMAFARLQNDSRDAIIGPCHDGCPYLIALKTHQPEVLSHISWETKPQKSDQNPTLSKSPLRWESLPPLASIHTYHDWKRLIQSPLGAAFKKALGEPLEDSLPQR